jgi:hypothetical protein
VQTSALPLSTQGTGRIALNLARIIAGNGAQMSEEHLEPSARPSRRWTPHLWALVVPLGAVALAYVLWFALMALLSLPDWLARMR